MLLCVHNPPILCVDPIRGQRVVLLGLSFTQKRKNENLTKLVQIQQQFLEPVRSIRYHRLQFGCPVQLGF
jgi:hypothetical protein